jgi:sarcosine oxidase subunit beta
MDLKTADVVIVGAGVVGCSIAFHLASMGVPDVLLIEKSSAAGQGSTSKANGGIRAQWSTEINIRLSLYSIAAYERFAEETGGDCGLVQAGYLFMSATESGERALRANFELQQRLGVPNCWLRANDIERMAPYVSSADLRCGTFSNRDGFIDPHGCTFGYLKSARRLGARVVTGAEVLSVERDAAGVTGVAIESGTIATRTVVNAAGPFAGILGRRAQVEVPVLPYKRMLACTEAIGGAPALIPMTIDLDTGLLIRREGSGILMAYSDPADPPGFETNFDPQFLAVVAEKAAVRFPFLEDARMSPQGGWAGLYPETEDHHAILGQSPELAGFYLAVGFGGHGIMHAPATGRAIAEMIVHGQCRFMDVTPLRPQRFREKDLVVETTVL